MDTYGTLNEILVKMFNDIMDLEQNALISDEFKNISNNDMHILEAIGIGEAKNMSQVAKQMKVTVGTLTIAMNNLVKKGYVIRAKSQADRRVVLISLSDLGISAFKRHARFHEHMVETVIKEMDEEELVVLLKALVKLENYFKKFYEFVE